jgi:outer membrane protein OmpA-like peptidoglycan-associated protein
MLKGVLRLLVLLLLGLIAVPALLAGGRPVPSRAKARNKKAASVHATLAKTSSAAAQSQNQKQLSPKQIRIMNEGVGEHVGQWVPMPSTDGTPGLFTIDTGITLPKGGFDVTGFGYKYGRAPGSLNLFEVGWRVGYGITNRLTVFGGWDVYRHIHLGYPGELSSLGSSRPVYNEQYPFAYENNGGIGPVVLGAEYGIFSETRGNPFNLAVRDEAYIPTHTGLHSLLNEGGVQTGAFDDLIGASVSKTFANVVNWSFDYGHLITRDPRSGGVHLVTLADQEQLGTGFIFFPHDRFQVLTEYDATIFDGNATPTTTFGPRDPVQGIWGFRVYPWRMVSVDLGYLYMLNLPQIRDRNGFIFNLSTEYWPGKRIPRDIVTVTSTAHPHSVQQDSGQMVNLTAQGKDSLGYNLTYTWTAPAGKIVGSGPNVQWDPTGVDPGKYTITVRAEDPYGSYATSSQEITVTPKPVPPPTMVCTSARPSILPGERVGITATVTDTSGTPLTYMWRTTGGTIIGSGASVMFDSTGLAPGTYTITGRVQNGKGQAADCQAQVTVQAPPPPKPQASKIDQCFFPTFSTRVNNVCKRILDNVALRLQTETGAHVVVIGYATPYAKTARSRELAEGRAAARAENTKKYLVSKGISADRVETRTGTPTPGASVKQNNRIEIIWVPEGATY